jgi:photosystem II stability/assembly factor-like uncharacterized protein
MKKQRDRGTEGRGDKGIERWRPLYLFVSLPLCLSVSLSLRPFCLPVSGQRLEWSAQSSGALAKLYGVFFVDRDRGWVVGSGGALLTTEDGGAKWRRQALPERQSGETLNDVWFFNPDRGLLLGEYGLVNRKGEVNWSERAFLLTSKDRGANWEAGALQRSPIGSQSGDTLKNGRPSPDPILLRMSFANDQAGWAVGESGSIQRTIDGGATWTPQESPTRKLLYDVAAIDDGHAWAVGAGGTVLRTVDGGRNWDEQPPGVIQALRAVHFADSKRGRSEGNDHFDDQRRRELAAANVGRGTEPQRRGLLERERRLDRRRSRTAAAYDRWRRDMGERRSRRALEPFETVFHRARLRLGRRDERRDF